MERHRIITLTVLFCLLSTVQPVFADGIVRDSVGATSGGRGGTNIGHSDNGAILLNNPAGMVNIKGMSLDEFGIDALITDIAYSDPENSAAAKLRPGALPEFSMIRKSEDGNWAVGFGVFAPAGFSANWELKNPTLGSNGYNSFGALVSVLPGFSYKVNDKLSLGATLGVAVSHVELETPLYLQTGALAGTPTSFDLQATGAAPTWSFGMQYQLNDRTTIGAVYQSETRFGLDGNVLTDVYGLGPQPITSKFDAEIDVVWPRSAGIGLIHDFSDNQRFSFDAVWYNWSHAFDRFDIKLTNSSNPFFTGLLGPKITDSFPLNWKDSVSFRFGYELFRENGDIWRAGYIYNTRQLPSSTLTPLIPAILEHTFSLGYSTFWNDSQFNLAYQYGFGPERKVGTSAFAGGDFSFSSISAQAHWVSLSWIKEF